MPLPFSFHGQPYHWGRRLLVGALLTAAAIALLRPQTPAKLVWKDVPFDKPPADYATSERCIKCHAQEHQSWHSSFHRSMTQRASEQSILAPWQGRFVSPKGESFTLFRKDSAYWLTMPDPDIGAARQRHNRRLSQQGQSEALGRPHLAPSPQLAVERQVVMTTGSHYYQAYWVRGSRGNELWQVPFVYHIEEQRLLPRDAVFLHPPDDPLHTPRWNSNCIQCHSVGGQPRHDPLADEFRTEVSELGIACEACHGPGLAHVQRHDTWSERWGLAPALGDDPSIVNPGKLGARQSSAICGQCHSYFLPTDPDTWWQSGFVGHQPPEQPLQQARKILDLERDSLNPELALNAQLSSIFFADGTVRVGGREYNGLVKSPCFASGNGDRQMGCLSCHEMHGSNPSGQLLAVAENNTVCNGCHIAIADNLAQHTRHLPESSGSQCVNCHMPYTSYALLRGLRSHRIVSPNADKTERQAIPNACNLCHLDKPLAWTAQKLTQWFNHSGLRTEGSQVPQIVLEALSGEAGVRALAVHSLGWQPARQTNALRFEPIVLVEALADPYAAVRQMAWSSLRNYDEFSAASFDFVAPPNTRRAAQSVLRLVARRHVAHTPPWLTQQALDRVILTRDERAVRISE